MTFLSYDDMARDILKLIPFCLEHDISAIYGNPRSGMIAANMLAVELHIPCGPVGGELGSGNRLKVVTRETHGPALLLEDTVNNGNGINKSQVIMNMTGIKYLKACVYTKQESISMVDFCCKVIKGPRLYQWNIFNCDLTSKMMFDLDGVFCVDPPMLDDDGKEYQDYILNAIPLHIPFFPVGSICTNRIHRWRDNTITWLDRTGIQVIDSLYMQPYDSAKDRRHDSSPATFKAWCYEKSNAVLFVESTLHQAMSIATLTGKPVLSLETMRIF